MRRTSLFRIPVLVLAGLLLMPGSALGGTVGGRSFTLGDQPLALGDVSNYFCHNRDWPAVRCFVTEDELKADEGLRPESGSATAPLSLLITPYASMYRDRDYLGGGFDLYFNETNLSTIGWNDKVSSFKSYGSRPYWYRDINYSGALWLWPTGSWVTYVGDSANDKFSSVAN